MTVPTFAFTSVVTLQSMSTARMPLYNPGSRRGIFAPSDLVYGLCRAYAARADPYGQDVRVFRDLADAKAWVGLLTDGEPSRQPQHMLE